MIPDVKEMRIVISNGRTLLGRPSEVVQRELAPCFELFAGMSFQAGPGGTVQASWSCQIWPLMGFTSIDRVVYPEGAIVLDVAQFAPEEIGALQAQLAGCLENVMRMRVAARTGLDLGAQMAPKRGRH